MDWANIICYALFTYRYFYREPTRIWDPGVNGDCYFQSHAYAYANVWQRVYGSYKWQFGFMLAFTFWRTCKFLQLVPIVVVPFKALVNALSEVFALLAVFIVMTIGFAWVFQAEYAHMEEFSTIIASIISLLSILCFVLDPSDTFVGYGKSYTARAQIICAGYILVMDL